jgi:hypothetical protein
MEVISIVRSPIKFKKYRANVIYKGKQYNNVDFGDTRYQQFKDQTPLKLYSNLDNNDPIRRKSYLARHKHNDGPAGYLSRNYLW